MVKIMKKTPQHNVGMKTKTPQTKEKNNEKTAQDNAGMKTKTPQNNVRIMKKHHKTM